MFLLTILHTKFHVNLTIKSQVMTIFIYKAFDQNFSKSPVWNLPNICELRRVKDTKFGMNVSNGSYLTLHGWKATVFAIFELFCKKKQGKGALKCSPPPPPKLGLRNILHLCNDFFINLCLQVIQGKHWFGKYSQILKNSKPL